MASLKRYLDVSVYSTLLLFKYVACFSFFDFQKYKAWKTRHLILKSDASLDSIIVGNKQTVDDTHDLLVVNLITIRISDDSANVLEGRVGIKVICKKDGHDTNFRCIIKPYDLEGLVGAIARVSKVHNVHEFLKSCALVRMRQQQLQPGEDSIRHAWSSSSAISAWRAINAVRVKWYMQRVIDKQDRIMMKESIRKRRGAFEDLPVLFSNDLVHGSWWFLFGSVFITIASSVVLWNSYNEIIGNDDSFLTRTAYRASWALLVASGFFCIIGSFAFIRAMNDPPMRPLCKCRHFATDELLGSWFFALATLPGVPYCLIFLAFERDLVYLAMLVFSILSFLGSCLFVRGSYPVPETVNKHLHHSYFISYYYLFVDSSMYKN